MSNELSTEKKPQGGAKSKSVLDNNSLSLKAIGCWLLINRTWIIGYSLATVMAVLAWDNLFVPDDSGKSAADSSLQYITYLFSILLFYGAVIFVQVFTKPIEKTNMELMEKFECDALQRVEEQKRRWLVFAYAFMLFSLFSSILPFVFKIPLRSAEEINEKPIAVFIGCAVDSDKFTPEELHCKFEDGDASNKKMKEERAGMWVINIGGTVQSCPGHATVNCVSGGLVVPLYIVILALFGGAISLTRRIPEYQKQAAANYVVTDPNIPKLEMHKLREYLVFQIVQFISAPFIAVVAYYLVNPTETAYSVTLGFAAGFASETILLMIRAMVEKVTPEKLATVSIGSISGYVKSDKIPPEHAQVRVVGKSELNVATDDNGCFVIEAVSAGEHTVEIKLGDEAKMQQVRVEASRTTMCYVKF